MHAPVGVSGKGMSRAYRDPSRTWGSAVIISGLLLIAVIQYKPWENNWEGIRMFFGAKRTVPIAGSWEVVQAVAVDTHQTMLVPPSATKAAFDFSPTGQARMSLEIKAKTHATSGSYRQNGANLVLAGLRPISKATKWPAMITIKLAWTGDDEIVASVGGSQTLYLRRMSPDEKPGAFASYRAMGGRMVKWP